MAHPILLQSVLTPFLMVAEPPLYDTVPDSPEAQQPFDDTTTHPGADDLTFPPDEIEDPTEPIPMGEGFDLPSDRPVTPGEPLPEDVPFEPGSGSDTFTPEDSIQPDLTPVPSTPPRVEP